jgi:hypothetical protein
LISSETSGEVSTSSSCVFSGLKTIKETREELFSPFSHSGYRLVNEGWLFFIDLPHGDECKSSAPKSLF